MVLYHHRLGEVAYIVEKRAQFDIERGDKLGAFRHFVELFGLQSAAMGEAGGFLADLEGRLRLFPKGIEAGFELLDGGGFIGRQRLRMVQALIGTRDRLGETRIGQPPLGRVAVIIQCAEQ